MKQNKREEAYRTLTIQELEQAMRKGEAKIVCQGLYQYKDRIYHEELKDKYAPLVK